MLVEDFLEFGAKQVMSTAEFPALMILPDNRFRDWFTCKSDWGCCAANVKKERLDNGEGTGLGADCFEGKQQ